MSRHTGFASLPLHGGKAPAWLFGRMVRLSREIVIYLARPANFEALLGIEGVGPKTLPRRLATFGESVDLAGQSRSG